jgi:hypothetical protein
MRKNRCEKKKDAQSTRDRTDRFFNPFLHHSSFPEEAQLVHFLAVLVVLFWGEEGFLLFAGVLLCRQIPPPPPDQTNSKQTNTTVEGQIVPPRPLAKSFPSCSFFPSPDGMAGQEEKIICFALWDSPKIFDFVTSLSDVRFQRSSLTHDDLGRGPRGKRAQQARLRLCGCPPYIVHK